MNTTEGGPASFHQDNIFFAAFYILIFSIAVPGNALALWAFFRKRCTTPSKVFLRNLAIADISYILILPMRVVYHFSDNRWDFGWFLCHLAGFLFYLNLYSSMYLMTFISLDRLAAITLPVKSNSVRKVTYAKIVAGILWVIVIVSMSPLLLSKKYATDNSSTCSQLYLEKTSPSALVSTIVAFAIPFITILVSYILIIVKLRVMQQHKKLVRSKAVRMIVITMINFLIAFVPYHVNRVIYIKSHTGPVAVGANGALARVNRITSALTCVSSVIDPIMYFFLATVYRKNLLNIFCMKVNSEANKQKCCS